MHFSYEPRFPLSNFLPQLNSMKKVTEPSRTIPVLTECDVAVFGGGPSGVCAAAAAARAGKYVILVERHSFLGGMATAAWVNIIHSFYGMDKKTKIVGGLAEEFIRRLQAQGAAYNLNPDAEIGDWVIDSEIAKFAFDDIAIGSCVRLLFHTWLVGAIRDGRRINAVLIEGKSGRLAIVADVYIDCTGDADLIRRSGIETQLGNGFACQSPSLCFRIGGKEPQAAPLSKVAQELSKTPMDYNGQYYPAFLWGDEGVFSKSEHMMAGTRVLNVNCSDSLDFTRAEVEARYQLRWLLSHLKKIQGWESSHLLDVATQIGIRETHRILADHQLTREEILYGTKFDDAVAQGTYPIDIHKPDGPGIYFERLDGTTLHMTGLGIERGRWDGLPLEAPPRHTLCYQIPYRSLIPRDLDNVLVAGRCIGTDHESAGAIRVMINCMQMGQAAGTAASLFDPEASVRHVRVKELQGRLESIGQPLR